MRRISRHLLIAAAGLMPFILFANTQPGKTPAPVPTSQPQPAFIRVAFTNFPPWCYKDDKDQYQGILVDFFQDLSQDINLPLKVEDVPIARLHHSLSHGKLDLFVSRIPEKDFDCCLSLGKAFDTESVVIGRKSGPPWEIPPKAQYGICRTGLSGYIVPGCSMFDANSLDTCVRMVARNRIPFLIGERFSLQKVLQKEPPEIRNLFSPAVVVEKKEFHFFINKHLDQSSFGPALRKAIAQRKLMDYISRHSDSKP